MPILDTPFRKSLTVIKMFIIVAINTTFLSCMTFQDKRKLLDPLVHGRTVIENLVVQNPIFLGQKVVFKLHLKVK